MRVLWICNILIPAIAKKMNRPFSVREGWLSGTLDRMVREDNQEITLGICFPFDENQPHFHETISLVKSEIECYGFYENLNTPQHYDETLETRFKEIFDSFKPDIVHIFGTEFPHTLAAAKVWNRPSQLLIGLQGIISLCADEYLANLPDKVVKRNTFRDWLKKDGILAQQQKFYLRGENEKKALGLTANVTGRTQFDKQAALNINPNVTYYPMNETMRDIFYYEKWDLSYCRKHRIFVSQADYPLKGMHYLLQAMPKILERFPDAEIEVGGINVTRVKTRMDRIKIGSYGKYLRDTITEMKLTKKVIFLGQLTGEEMREQLLISHTLVCASILENSPNSVAEAMLLGVPVVAANTGGIPSMITDKTDGVLFQKGNADDLADKIIALWEDDDKCVRISKAEREKARIAHDPVQNYRRLISIYQQIK